MTEQPLILFDGVCNLCHGGVQFILRHDVRERFHFAALQSKTGRRVLLEAGLDPDELSTFVLRDADGIHVRSTAALRIARRLRFPWPLAVVFFIVPRPVRDAVYRWVARNRYRWFGKKDECWLPTPDIQKRFLT